MSAGSASGLGERRMRTVSMRGGGGSRAARAGESGVERRGRRLCFRWLDVIVSLSCCRCTRLQRQGRRRQDDDVVLAGDSVCQATRCGQREGAPDLDGPGAQLERRVSTKDSRPTDTNRRRVESLCDGSSRCRCCRCCDYCLFVCFLVVVCLAFAPHSFNRLDLCAPALRKPIRRAR